MNGLGLQTFKGRRVLVTGHTGFKGSWLALWLQRLGSRVAGYALAPPSEPSHFAVSGVRDVLAGHYEADIRDAQRLQEAMAQADPDIVFHLAAQALVLAGHAAPRETFEVNAIGTAAVLDAVRARQKPCVVIVVTSDKCYANTDPSRPCRESDPMGGHDPYSASKGAAELVAAAYRHSFFNPRRLAEHGVKLATVRAGNVIGGGDWARDRIVSDVVSSLMAGRPAAVRRPQAVRPWQHVLQALHGYLMLSAKMLQSNAPCWCDAWNFGPLPGRELPVAGLVDLFLAAWGGGSWQDVSGGDCPHEDPALRLNVEKATKILGWRPAWDIEETVRRTARWYRRFYDQGGTMREASLDDIDAYTTACGPLVAEAAAGMDGPSDGGNTNE